MAMKNTTRDGINALGFAATLALLVALLGSGCGAQASSRSNTAAVGFAALACGSVGGTLINGVCYRRPPVAVCVCSTDADCARKCGGSY